MNPLFIRHAAITIALLSVLGLAGAAAVFYSGVYNVASTRQHTQFLYSLLEQAMHRSVQVRARNIETPALDEPGRIARGALLFHDKCVQCHGAPGVSQGDIGKSMQPVPGPLVDAMQHWRPREVYWVTRHGIKMSGMPAWEFRMDDASLWDITAFVQHLPSMTPQDYAAAVSRRAADVAAPPSGSGSAVDASQATAATDAAATRTTTGDVERGRQALYQYACNACHSIPGVTGSAVNVGPPLEGFASRSLIAGRLSNTQANLVDWLRHPKAHKPLTAMPDLGVSQVHAEDMAAYLATLR